MVQSRLLKICSRVRDFLFNMLNKEFLIFLFFLALSGSFWLLLKLNDIVEKELYIPIRLVNVPKNVVITNETDDTLRVTVKDKGFSLVPYFYGNRILPLNINFATYTKTTEKGSVSSTELQRMIYSMLYTSTRITSMKPDKWDYYYNYGLNKRVPVKLSGHVVPGASYYLSRTSFWPDSVTVYASPRLLDSIRYVPSETLNITNFTDTIVRKIRLKKIPKAKIMPSEVMMTLYPDILTEESFEVPVSAVNIPAGKILRTFPSRVKVRFIVGASMFRKIRPEEFKAVVDYLELPKNTSEKCKPYIRSVPHGVSKSRLDITELDYLIEQQ